VRRTPELTVARFPCAVCGEGNTIVKDVQATHDHLIRRRRQCPKGHLFWSIEVPLPVVAA